MMKLCVWDKKEWWSYVAAAAAAADDDDDYDDYDDYVDDNNGWTKSQARAHSGKLFWI